MHFLPKVNPLYEHVDALKINLPDTMEKLGIGGFTGYLSHTAGDFESNCIYARGKLICAVCTENNKSKFGFEAIGAMFDRIFSSGGTINVYRMTTGLAMCAHALLVGTRLFSGEEVRQVDIKTVLARLKSQALNGVIRFWTPEHNALLFYKDGQPIGFYHDGAQTIETSPDESRKVAALPGARIEVSSTKPIEELMHFDLLQMVNLGKLWESAGARRASTSTKQQKLHVTELTPKQVEKLPELVEDLQEIAMAYLSREGRILVQNILAEQGGNSILCNTHKTEAFLNTLEKQALDLDGDARIDEMIDLMKSEIAGRLAT